MSRKTTVSKQTLRLLRTALPILERTITIGCVLAASGTLLAAVSEPADPFQTLHFFTGVPDGIFAFAGLTAGKDGTLYGATQYGGNSPACSDPVGCGAIFQLKPPSSPGGAWSESVIYSFPTFSFPLGSPTVGPNGELYGTDYYGGQMGVGSVYELQPPSSPGGAWTETTLYTFSPAFGDPQNPAGGVVLGANGVLYGTVQFAGLSPNCPWSYSSLYGCGGVFSLTPSSSPGGTWTFQTLYIFQGANDGAVPLTSLVIGNRGELYGTTYYGGGSPNCSLTSCGTVFELDPPGAPGGAWSESILHSFSGTADGGYPNSLIYQGGALFGTFTFGGDPRYCGGAGCGGVFQLSPPAWPGSSWTESVLYSFKGVPDGLFPPSGVVMSNDGTLYGTTLDGGDSKNCPENPGCGTVYELKRPHDLDDAWRERVLHSFTSTDGFRPTGGVVIGSDGNLYGTTWYGGLLANCTPGGGCGTVFQIKLNNSGEGGH